MLRFLVLLPLVACAETPAPASVEVAGDERLATLPADATLIASVDLPALAGVSGGAAWLSEAGLDPAPLLALAEAGAGVEGFLVRDARLGCGSTGCVALLEGNFTASGVDVAAEAAELRFPEAEWVLRRLSAHKAVFGDVEAVRAVWEAQRTGAPGLDVAALEGRVPAGGMWVFVRDFDRFEAQAAARAARVNDDGATRLHASAARFRAQVPSMDRVETMAISLTAAGTLRARAVCADESTALDVELRIRAAALDAQGLQGVEVSRIGPVVELTGHPRPGALVALLGVAK